LGVQRLARGPRRRLPGAVQSLALTALALLALPVASDQSPRVVPARIGLPHADTPDVELSGRQIYERVLANRFDAFLQKSRLTSGDRGGNTQTTRFDMWFQDFRNSDTDALEDKLLSKTLIRYTHPFDLRYTAYLIVNNLDAPSDQFLYIASERRTKRINLRGEAVFGSDFSFEDVLPREIEDATYERLPDAQHDGATCFAIRATPRPTQLSEYSHFLIYIEKQRAVPLLTRYWDEREVEVKELRAEREFIENHEGVWVPMRMTMKHLKHESFTTFEVDEIQVRARLDRDDFDLRRLESH